ncbi:MAG TPA: hypothetical protein VKU39_12025 [Streptosporangiaceae bacterium]|nr:hypothetical protein [Streptosporangiaceae bacterium]
MSNWSRTTGSLGRWCARGKGAGFAAGIALVLASGPTSAIAATAQPERALTPAAVQMAAANKVLPTPNPAGSTASLLNAVSCPSAASCTAVGEYFTGGGAELTLAEHWNGSAWAIQSTPNPAGASLSLLRGVSCTSARACVAVGTEVTSGGRILPLAERWNGSSWSLIPPAPGGPLAAVSCSSASACTAVGGLGSPLAERWNGSTWAIQPIATLSGATATALNGVSCPSATSCLAVGHWVNGGHTLALAERWNGTSWFFELPPNRSSSFNDLSAVTCTTLTACVAVGTFADPITGQSKTLGEFSSGTASWILTSTPSPGQTHSFLDSVSCATATSCTAIGDFDDIRGIEDTLGAFGTGTSWFFGATPTIPFENTFGRGVSCPTTTECILVGFDKNSAGTTVTFAGQTS